MESLHILLALLTLSMTSLHPEALSGKIIVFGGGGPTGGCPDTKMFLDHVAEWEEFLPVDGVLLATNPKSGPLIKLRNGRKREAAHPHPCP